MTINEFDSTLASASTPVIVDVWAPWCGPCRTMKPIIEGLGERYDQKVQLIEVNADESAELVQKLGVYALPTILVFSGGQERARRSGAQNEGALRELFEAAGENREIPKLRGRDRLLRIGAAALLYGLAGEYDPAWLLQTGALLLFFSAIHDRCPLLAGLKSIVSRRKQEIPGTSDG